LSMCADNLREVELRQALSHSRTRLHPSCFGLGLIKLTCALKRPACLAVSS